MRSGFGKIPVSGKPEGELPALSFVPKNVKMEPFPFPLRAGARAVAMTHQETTESSNPDLPLAEKYTYGRLVQYHGMKKGKSYPLSGITAVIGRSSSVGIMIKDSSVSRHHAMISQHENHYELEDMDSSNGTTVNGRAITGRVVLEDGDIIGFGSVLFKFIAKSRLESMAIDTLYQKATIDDVTGLFNKSYLMNHLTSEVRVSLSTGRELSLIYYGFDHFKKVNDIYGHHNGDRILMEGARLVSDLAREYDIPGRLGGEEFIIILPDTGPEAAVNLAEKLCKTFETHDFPLKTRAGETIDYRQTISVGVTCFSKDMASVKGLIAVANRKMRQSKENGCNRITF